MYFKEFPAFLYDFKYEDGTTKTEVVKDITRNVRVKKEILSNITLYDYYDLTDGDTPEIIAEKFYGNPEYHWIVMLTNDKIDWLADFPLTETEITKHIEHTYNPTLNSKEWWFETEPDPAAGLTDQVLYFKIYNNVLPLDPEYLTTQVEYNLSGSTTNCTFNYTFTWPDIRDGKMHNGLDRETQIVFQILPHSIGTITSLPSSKEIHGTNTQFTTNLVVNMDLYTLSGVKLGRIKSIKDDRNLILYENASAAVTNSRFNTQITGESVGELTITTTGRENNPVLFVNSQGYIVNPAEDGAIPVTGDQIHRAENDKKRRIKLVSPALIETIIKNYEELL